MVYIIRISACTVKGHDKKSYKILESAEKTGYHTKLFPLRMTARLFKCIFSYTASHTPSIHTVTNLSIPHLT